MKNGIKGLLVVFIAAISLCSAQARCVSYATRGAGWTVTSKDCIYTFKANKLTDSSCFQFAWYQGKTLLGTGSTYTKTFKTNDSAEYKLVIKNICDTTCADTTIEKMVAYNCAPKCTWASKKPGYTFTNKNCVYTFEANNLNDSCVTYKWYKGADSIGTGRLLTYTFKENGYSTICLKVIDTCQDCDTSICKIMQYNCGSTCNWKSKNAGWSYSKTGCTYVFEGNNLKDSCITYSWVKGSKVLGTGRIFTYVLDTDDTTEICLRLKDTCNKCDTVICKDIVGDCGSKCNWKSRNVGYSFSNKDCVYTFEANNLKDSCVLYKWYKGSDLIGIGRLLTYTFKDNGYSTICLKMIDTCLDCDTSICKIMQYNCGSKCDWKSRNAGWGYTKRGCTYTFEANNIRDSCVTYTWAKGTKVLGTGRIFTYVLETNDTTEICLKLKDTCIKCDTVICKDIVGDCGSHCNWKSRNAGYSFTNKDCVYTFEANNLKDSCVLYKWYKGSDFIGTGRLLTYTFKDNGYSNFCLKLIDTCNKCDTSICKIMQYNCGSKCDWKARNAGWDYTKKGCTYILEANNLRDTCVSYTWVKGGKVLGTGRLLTYNFAFDGVAEICLKMKDNCKNCDTTICKAIRDSCATGIGYLNRLNKELIVYPNPSNSGFTIEKLLGSNPTVTLYNSIGVKVLADPIIQNNSIYLSTENLSNGVYLLRYETGAAVLTQRIIVRH